MLKSLRGADAKKYPKKVTIERILVYTNAILSASESHEILQGSKNV